MKTDDLNKLQVIIHWEFASTMNSLVYISNNQHQNSYMEEILFFAIVSSIYYTHCIPLTSLIPSHFCDSQARTSISNVTCRGVFVFSEIMGEVIVHLVDISEIVHHHSLKLLFIINTLVISYTHSKGKGVMDLTVHIEQSTAFTMLWLNIWNCFDLDCNVG